MAMKMDTCDYFLQRFSVVRSSVVREAFGEDGWCDDVSLRNPKLTLSISTFAGFESVPMGVCVTGN